MRCLRCGYCCINYDVVILIDPDAGLVPNNMEHKPAGTRCRHLLGNTVGEFSCSMHDHPSYKSTPCHDFGQIEDHPDDPCRIGEYTIAQGITKIIPIQRTEGL